MCHAGAADRLDESFLNDALLDIEGELAGTLLRCAPANTVRISGNIFHFPGLDPLRFFRNGSRAVMYALMNDAHILYF